MFSFTILIIYPENYGIVIRMIIRVGIAGKIGFRLADFDSDFFVGGLDEGQVIVDSLLHLREVPDPAAVAALKVDAAVGDEKRIDEFERQMLI